MASRVFYRHRRLALLLIGFVAVFSAARPGHAVDIEDTPLFISTAVSPNVMLQFDNSGSMDSIIWHEDYVPTNDYSGPYEPSQNRDYYYPNYWGEIDEGWADLKVPGSTNVRYHYNYLNFLLGKFGDEADLTNGQIPSQTRLEVAKQVAKQLVTDNQDVRFGLTAFNYDEGGYIAAECATGNQATLKSSIDGLGADTWTPLAETYYEITRYFRGLSRYWGDGDGRYESPVEYPCQKNFVIVITDGLPTYDYPNIDAGDDQDVPGPDGQSLPNWDGEHEAANDPPYPQYSDGTDPGSESSAEGATLYLDDLAKFGYELDLGKYQDFSNADEFEQQRLETYAVGFTVDNQMLEDAAEYGQGEYFTANDKKGLTDALQGALGSIADKTSTAASLAASSTEAAGDTLVFQARFRSGDWSGELSAYPYESVGDDSAVTWNASEGIPDHDRRTIYTVGQDGAGIEFVWNSLDATAQSALDDNAAILTYIRGDRSNEADNGGDFRTRSGVLGDIIHSTPVFVGDQSYGYSLLPGSPGNSYRGFVLDKGDRADAVVVGANDGMLHAFKAGDGTELFAYVPRSLFSKLPTLADPDYQHQYYVDGSPAVADAYLGSNWRTVSVTTLGAGGSGIFALDVTDPAGFAAEDVLWDIDASNATMAQGQGATDPGNYFGEAMGTPAVVRTESGHWVAIAGNGYNSAAGSAALLVIDLATGEVLRVLDTQAGSDNGLATPAAVDRDRNGSIDTVYAGDLQGNLWKFDFSGSNVASWSVDYTGEPLFTARDQDGARQPITARPDAMVSPYGGLMVVFGTGKYLGTNDPDNSATQSVYGIWDVEGAVADDGTAMADTRVTDLNQLQRQDVLIESTIGGSDVRVLSRNSVAYESGVRGWVFDLSYTGERINRDVTIFDGKAIMVSTIPNTDPCSFGGRSALFEINPLTGTQFDEPVLDLNEDDSFDSDDGVTHQGDAGKEVLYPASVTLDVGLATNPNILIRDDGDHEKQITGSNLNTQVVGEKGFFRPGRASWQQLR